MKNVTQAEILQMASKLEARGTRLRPGADNNVMEELEIIIGGPISRNNRTIFSVFDGFDVEMADDPTMVCLWSIESIKKGLKEHRPNEKGLIIGDYFLAAELFRCDLKNDKSAVWWNERNIIAASNLYEFLYKIVKKTIRP